MPHGDAQRTEMDCGAYAGAHQDGRAAIRPCAEHDPVGPDDAAIGKSDPVDAKPVEEEVDNGLIRPHRQIRGCLADGEVRVRGRDPSPIPGAHGHAAHADGIGSIDVIDHRHSARLHRVERCGVDRGGG